MISVRQADDSIFSAPFEKAYQILIDAYARSEMEIWGENYARISKEEYSSLIRNGEVYFAFLAEEVVGCIQVFRLNTSSYSFGLLAVDELKNGLGIGRELIRTAEQLALTNDATIMEIEILKAENIPVEAKKILHDWYTRLGYKYYATTSFIALKPDKIEKAKNLINPSVFDQYRKVLN